MDMIPKSEFPRPERERARWMNLNGAWDFRLFPEGTEAEEKQFDGTYDRKITVPFSWTCPLSGVARDVAGTGWYRRRVTFPAKGRVFLCFGGADYLTRVYVNGEAVCEHRGAYTAFECDVTGYWKQGENEIAVRCEDYRRETQPYGKQGYGDIQGIWQTVWLEDRPEAYIKEFRFDTKCSGEVRVTASCDCADGAVLEARFGGETARGVVQNGAAELTMRFAAPRLWCCEDPYLYEGTLSLAGGDEVRTYFGIREVGTAKAPGKDFRYITLNGKPLYLNGTLDQAFNPEGHFTYPSEEAVRKEAWRLKRLGLNLVRIHIKAEEPRKLYWMDRMGILVMEDMPCFHGAPNEEAKAAYEEMWPEMIRRDINHPSTIAWVMFNESWGLLDATEDGKAYLPATQEWVRSVYRRAKAMDPSRIVEDNSPCRYDHVETDINTWHFYINGYENVREHLIKGDENTRPGSAFNFTGGNAQTDAPWMNSECGMVWGVDESAGDSDIAWQYHYMLNEFRLHEKLCGFVFTEFHDVVNEFNGYYRLDDTDKDFGYQDMCRGMTVCDLHAQDFLALDCPPCRTVAAGDKARVRAVLSSFTDARRAEGMRARWELWHDGLDGCVTDDAGTLDIAPFGCGTTEAGTIECTMPSEDAVAVLSVYLTDITGRVVSRNFTTFDVRGADMSEIPVSACQTEGFAPVWTALGGQKLCMGGEGEVSFTADVPDDAAALTLFFEASSKRVLRKDLREAPAEDKGEHNFMRGYRVDRGAFRNSYWMTDEEDWPSEFTVLADGVPVLHRHLYKDPADSRGVLSWHMQPTDRLLDEAGSYGERFRAEIPSRLIHAGTMRFTIRVSGKGGLALYGRLSGRYAHGVTLRVRHAEN